MRLATFFGVLCLAAHSCLLVAAAWIFSRAISGDSLTGMICLLLAGSCMFCDLFVGPLALRAVLSRGLTSRVFRGLFGLTTLFGSGIGACIGLTTLGLFLPLPWSRAYGVIGIATDLGGSLAAIGGLIVLVGAYVTLSLRVSFLTLFASDQRLRNSGLLPVPSEDDSFGMSWRMPPNRYASHETFAQETSPGKVPAPPAPPESSDVVPEESEDDRAREARRIVGILGDFRADPQTVIHALEAAGRLAWKVPGYLQFELRRAVVALTEDSRSIEQGDPREGLPPCSVGERALACLRQWPRAELS